MHAVFLTFEYAGQSDDLAQTFGTYIDSVPGDSGIVTCTWMADGSTVGGFFVFRNSDAAERFLNSPRIRAVASHPEVYDFFIRHFSTLSSISAAMPASLSALQTDDVVPGNACAVWQASIDDLAAHQSSQTSA